MMNSDRVPGGRFWEPEDDRLEDELLEMLDDDEIDELPFDLGGYEETRPTAAGLS